MTPEPFTIHVADDVLDDLRERLRRTRFTSASDSVYWAAGVDPGYLRSLVGYWAEEFDWRAAEARLNAYPQFLADVDGTTLHYVHLRRPRVAGEPEPLALVLSHGWPSSFVEMLRISELLTDFDLVIPSLPGYGFSSLPPSGRFTRRGVAELWHKLMTGTLGYSRYGAVGGDIGGGVTQWLGALFPEQVVGIHVTSALIGAAVAAEAVGEEREFLDRLAAYDVDDQGYSEIMSTRPDTVAAALSDSPAGLVAWIADKYRDWSDCDGDVEKRWDKDTLLTVATLYWVTDTIGTSFRQYYDYERLNVPVPEIRAPGAITLSNEPGLVGYPRSLAERQFRELVLWHVPERGGHFMAHEEPAQLAVDVQAFFGTVA
jgi:pimeloyl-ACP methyl ester carboxylesterase